MKSTLWWRKSSPMPMPPRITVSSSNTYSLAWSKRFWWWLTVTIWWASSASASGLGFCRSDPHRPYTVISDHVCRRGIRPMRLWKKLCFVPSRCSYAIPTRSFRILISTPRSAAFSSAFAISWPVSSSRHSKQRTRMLRSASSIRCRMRANAASPPAIRSKVTRGSVLSTGKRPSDIGPRTLTWSDTPRNRAAARRA